MGTTQWVAVNPRDADELSADEAAQLERAERLDSGTLAEQLAAAADRAAYTVIGADELRALAAMAIVLARRQDAAVNDDD